MNRLKLLIDIIVFFTLGVQHLYAQDDYFAPPLEEIQRPYKFTDHLFYGYTVGGSYSMSSFVAEQPFFSMLRPNGDFFIGKAFSKLLLAKLSLGYHCQIASISDEALYKMCVISGDEDLMRRGPNYSIHMANTSADGMICFNRLFGNHNQNARVKVFGLAGVGMNAIFAYSKTSYYWQDYININRKMKLAPEIHFGAATSFRMSEHRYFNIQATWHQTTKNYTGLFYSGLMRHYVELKFGVSKRMINRYASYDFENCKGNEKYYFDILEKRVLDDYAKKIEKHQVPESTAMENDTILSFPHTYPYLTPYQTTKVEKMLARLKANPEEAAVIDVYPYCTSDDDMTFVQSVDRCKEELVSIIDKLLDKDDNVQPTVYYIEHTESSPVRPEGIWFHNAFIHYESK